MRIHLDPDRHDTHLVSRDKPLRLGADGLVTDGRDAAVSFVRVAGQATPDRVVLVARPGVRVRVGAREVVEVLELAHRDHVLVGDLELLFNADQLPLPIEPSADAGCGVCCEARGEAGRELFACPSCGGVACAKCRERVPEAKCPTAGCPSPAGLDRKLWEPRPEDFLGFEDGGAA